MPSDRPSGPRNAANDDTITAAPQPTPGSGPVAGPATGHDRTIAAGAAPPTTGVDQTVAATSASGSPAPSDEPLARRVDRDADYPHLVAVDARHYVVGRELARGGMGRILAARDRRLGRPVAIKELLVTTAELRARFEREARITATLQHPAIVSVLEAGAWPSGEPFYVMKLVSGQSLDKVIGTRATLPERLGLLPNVIAVVDALAYAHEHRVIHRDLKPANVLAGEFGETVVIDWGLAKDLDDTSGAPEPEAGPYRSPPGGGETVAGAVMGTPAYMPAEQARGEVVDERADVYALGALLYHVLAGAPPYTGKTTNEILEAVIEGPPPPLGTRAPGVPADLVTIVTKAMAYAAADRYPTAKGLAEDLKKFQTGQLVGAHRYSAWQLFGRWIRRHRVPVAVAGVATLLLAVLGVVSVQRIVREQARTERQREAAARSRGEAEDLLGFMLVDLRAKLEPLGKLPLLDDVAQKAVTYYDQRSEDLSDTELAKRALSRRNLGDVLKDEGHAADAMREYRAALAIAESLAAEDPTNATWQRDLAVSHQKVGDELLVQGDAAGALVEDRTAQTIAEALVANDPANASWQQTLSAMHTSVGDVLLEQGDTAGALAAYRAALAISESQARQDPTNVDWQQALSADHQSVAGVLLVRGDTADALADDRAALAIAETLAAKDPANVVWRENLAISHDKVGQVLLAQGDRAGALGEYRAYLAIGDALVAQDPSNARWQRNLSVIHIQIGDVLVAQGAVADALPDYRASLTICETLVARDPANAHLPVDLAISHQKVGDVLLAQGDPASALAEYRAVVAIVETLAAKDPANGIWRRNLAVSHEKVGDVLRAQGDTTAALAEYRGELAVFEALVAEDPTNTDRQTTCAVTHIKVGDMLRAQGDTTAALAEYRAARGIFEVLAAQDPSNALWQRDVFVARIKIGDMLAARRDRAGALAEYRAALAIAEALAAQDPGNAPGQADLAESHEHVGDLLAARGDRSGARVEYEAGLVVA